VRLIQGDLGASVDRAMSDLVWLDLCSGLGGASQPALDRGWKVIRVDIDPRFKPDIVADVRALPLNPFHVDVLWCSTVCTDFTRWGMRKYASWAFKNPPSPPSTDLTVAAKSIIDEWSPRWWVLENVMFSREFLTPILGPVRAISGGHVLWGRCPGLIPQTMTHKWRVPPGPNQAAIRSAVPYPIGEAICRAVEARRE
jgi:hypothetical protein